MMRWRVMPCLTVLSVVALCGSVVWSQLPTPKEGRQEPDSVEIDPNTLEKRLLQIEFDLAQCRAMLRRLTEASELLQDSRPSKVEVTIHNDIAHRYNATAKSFGTDVLLPSPVVNLGAGVIHLIEAYGKLEDRLDEAYKVVRAKLEATGRPVPELPRHKACKGRGVLFGHYRGFDGKLRFGLFTCRKCKGTGLDLSKHAEIH